MCDIATNDIRCYLAEQQEQRGLSKVTIDNLRRIYSSVSSSWLEDEDYITKSPVRRIHKVRTDALVKERCWLMRISKCYVTVAKNYVTLLW